MTVPMTDGAKIAWLEEQLAKANERLDRLDPKPKQPEPTNVDVYLRQALGKCKRGDGTYDLEAAAALFHAWMNQLSEVRDSIQPIIREALERRLESVAQSQQ